MKYCYYSSKYSLFHVCSYCHYDFTDLKSCFVTMFEQQNNLSVNIFFENIN